MNYWKLLVTVFFFFLINNPTLEAQGLDRTNLYKALETGQSEAIDHQLSVLKDIKGNDKTAFEGALLMRKSALLKVPAQKLNTFKQGHRQLELAIRAEPKNVEYRFLRLMIQEHAPKMLHYKGNLLEDSQLIAKGFKSLQPTLKTIVLNYSKTSKALPESSLK